MRSPQNDLPSPGGKAFRLLKAKEIGLPVPPFLLLPLSPTEIPFERIERELGEGPFFVRTSFAGEDEEPHTFAGIGLSVGHLCLSELPEAVEKVSRSWETALARAYREEKGIAGTLSGSIIIQKEIVPLYSGVFFTRSPQAVGGFFLIEGVPGYGEDLMQGRVKPFIIEGHERSRALLEPSPLRDDDLKRIVRKLLKIRGKLRKVAGGEADAEWVYDHSGKLWIVQVRPLTPSPPILSHSLAQEFWSGKVSPLMFSAVGSLIEEAMLKEPFSLFAEVPERVLIFKHQHVYIDIRPLLRALSLIPPWAVGEEILRHFPEPIRVRYRKEVEVYHPFLSLELLSVLLRLLRQKKAPVLPLLHPFKLKRFLKNPLLQAPPKNTREELLAEIRLLRSDLKDLLRLVVWGMVYSYIATPLLDRLLGKEPPPSLYQNLPFDPVQEFLRDLEDFARRWFRALYPPQGQDPTYTHFLEQLGPTGQREFFALCRRWAHRSEERDLKAPRIGDRPELLWELLLLFLKDTYRKRSLPWWRDLLGWKGRLPSPFSLLRGIVLLPLAGFTRLYLGFREAMRDTADRYLYALRLRFLRLAELEGKVVPWDSAWSDDDGFLPFLSEENEEEEPPPLFYLGETPLYEQSPREGKAPGIPGMPVSPGIGKGRGVFVAVIGDLKRFSPGDVLLGPYLDPTFAMALRHASAGVFACGGMLSHGAILAREFGVPVITGIPEPQLRRLEGKWIEVNALEGYLRVEDAQKEPRASLS